jgi:hypothetical protein
LAGKLRSPPTHRATPLSRPTSGPRPPTRVPRLIPTPATRVPHPLTSDAVPAGYAPRGAWSGQAEWMRFARLIDRPGRVLGGPAVRCRLRRLFEPALVATPSGAPCCQPRVAALAVGPHRRIGHRCTDASCPNRWSINAEGRKEDRDEVRCLHLRRSAAADPYGPAGQSLFDRLVHQPAVEQKRRSGGVGVQPGSPADGVAAHGIGSGEPCWSGPTASSPGAASAGPLTHHRARGVLRAILSTPR